VNDYEIGKRFGLDIINIMNDDGTLNAAAGPYAGMDRFAGGRLQGVGRGWAEAGGCPVAVRFGSDKEGGGAS
jgi:hypothetical protein